jgi:hypothetical protein
MGCSRLPPDSSSPPPQFGHHALDIGFTRRRNLCQSFPLRGSPHQVMRKLVHIRFRPPPSGGRSLGSHAPSMARLLKRFKLKEFQSSPLPDHEERKRGALDATHQEMACTLLSLAAVVAVASWIAVRLGRSLRAGGWARPGRVAGRTLVRAPERMLTDPQGRAGPRLGVGSRTPILRFATIVVLTCLVLSFGVRPISAILALTGSSDQIPSGS